MVLYIKINILHYLKGAQERQSINQGNHLIIDT
jgi:hypothetical protein